MISDKELAEKLNAIADDMKANLYTHSDKNFQPVPKKDAVFEMPSLPEHLKKKDPKKMDDFDEIVYLQALISHLEWSLIGAQKLLEEKQKNLFPEVDSEFDQLKADQDNEYYGRKW